jgi:hypothetical protein
MRLDTTKPIIAPRPEGLSATDAASLPLVVLTAYTALVYYAGILDPPQSSTQFWSLVDRRELGFMLYRLLGNHYDATWLRLHRFEKSTLSDHWVRTRLLIIPILRRKRYKYFAGGGYDGESILLARLNCYPISTRY